MRIKGFKHGMLYSSTNLPLYNLYINGQWRTPETEQYQLIFDPSTGEALAQVAQAGIADTQAAIQAARTAFDNGDWAAMSPGERSRRLQGVPGVRPT